jgi:hypothetical protein
MDSTSPKPRLRDQFRAIIRVNHYAGEVIFAPFRRYWVELCSGTLTPCPIHGQVEECVNGMLQEVQAVRV